MVTCLFLAVAWWPGRQVTTDLPHGYSQKARLQHSGRSVGRHLADKRELGSPSHRMLLHLLSVKQRKNKRSLSSSSLRRAKDSIPIYTERSSIFPGRSKRSKKPLTNVASCYTFQGTYQGVEQHFINFTACSIHTKVVSLNRIADVHCIFKSTASTIFRHYFRLQSVRN
jgi:hypothetical protein